MSCFSLSDSGKLLKNGRKVDDSVATDMEPLVTQVLQQGNSFAPGRPISSKVSRPVIRPINGRASSIRKDKIVNSYQAANPATSGYDAATVQYPTPNHRTNGDNFGKQIGGFDEGRDDDASSVAAVQNTGGRKTTSLAGSKDSEWMTGTRRGHAFLHIRRARVDS